MVEREFQGFPKIARLSREVVVTEKIDGTNAQIFFPQHGMGAGFLVGSRTRWITPHDDNYGFARWCYKNIDELRLLGPGAHFGEWWGEGIQRGYGLKEKRFSLFNSTRWCQHDQAPKAYQTADPRIWRGQDRAPACCHVVPELYRGIFDTLVVESVLQDLEIRGSCAAPEYMRPEGIIIFHTAGNVGFKKTLSKDELPKTLCR